MDFFFSRSVKSARLLIKSYKECCSKRSRTECQKHADGVMFDVVIFTTDYSAHCVMLLFSKQSDRQNDACGTLNINVNRKKSHVHTLVQFYAKDKRI